MQVAAPSMSPALGMLLTLRLESGQTGMGRGKVKDAEKLASAY